MIVTAAGWAFVSFLLILQSTLLQAVSIAGAVPDLSLVAILWLSYHTLRSEGPIAAFFAGFSADFISSSPLGYHSFQFSVIAWCASLLSRAIRIEGPFLPILFGAAGTLVKFVSGLILSWILGQDRILAGSFLEGRLWVQVAYNAALSPFLFYALAPIRRRLNSGDWRR